jgi:glucarate dehydratase
MKGPSVGAAATVSRRPRIADVRITPIAFRDPPLLNVVGVHEPWALRSIIEIETDDGRIGLGESYGDLETLGNLAKAKPRLVGLDPFDLNGLTARVYEAVTGTPFAGQDFPHAGDKALASAIGAFEVAFLDLQGQIADRPLFEILGGAVRDRVAYSAYLFYKFARHKDDPGYPPDDWGEALTHAQMVEQTRRMVAEYGFRSIKLKAGVFEPDFEIETLRAIAKAFPGYPLRIDPNGGWSVATTRRLMPQFEGLLEYLEDPVNSLDEAGEVAKFSTLPLATNMVTVAFGHIPKTVRLGAMQVILTDHHYWGGLRATQTLAHYGRTFGLGISMHSNSHLGISLAAMTHVGVTIPNFAYACDTHYPWQVEEVVEGGRANFRFEGGSLAPPPGPGLGVRLDRAALAMLHKQYLDCGIRKRDDAKEMRKYRPDWNSDRPRY